MAPAGRIATEGPLSTLGAGSRRTMAKPIYRRVVVKVSGEALMGPDNFGIHQPTLEQIAADLKATHALGVGIGIVVGGGNIFRGVKVSEQGIPRVTGDMMGILATVMNALALESALERAGAAARTMSALAMPEVCETYERQRALRHLAEGRMVLLAAGTGNPFFTTDTTAVLRAAELAAEAVLKATDVDGVYSADPKQDKKAKRYDRLTHQQAIDGNLKVMDATAFALARENRIPIIVFSIRAKGAIEAVLRGEGRSTVVGF
jgi:uridylate kinase